MAGGSVVVEDTVVVVVGAVAVGGDAVVGVVVGGDVLVDEGAVALDCGRAAPSSPVAHPAIAIPANNNTATTRIGLMLKPQPVHRQRQRSPN